MIISSVSELVRAARNGQSQKQFASLLGVKQSSVSRYESGKASPPINVIEQCMRLVHTVGPDDAPTAEQLADRVRIALADPDMRQVRAAVFINIDAVPARSASRPIRPMPLMPTFMLKTSNNSMNVEVSGGIVTVS